MIAFKTGEESKLQTSQFEFGTDTNHYFYHPYKSCLPRVSIHFDTEAKSKSFLDLFLCLCFAFYAAIGTNNLMDSVVRTLWIYLMPPVSIIKREVYLVASKSFRLLLLDGKLRRKTCMLERLFGFQVDFNAGAVVLWEQT